MKAKFSRRFFVRWLRHSPLRAVVELKFRLLAVGLAYVCVANPEPWRFFVDLLRWHTRPERLYVADRSWMGDRRLEIQAELVRWQQGEEPTEREIAFAVDVVVNRWVVYEEDLRAWSVRDYLPTVAEMIDQSGSALDGKIRGDCGTIAVLGAAFLRELGVKANVEFSPGHAWVSYGETGQFRLFEAPPMRLDFRSFFSTALSGYLWVIGNVSFAEQGRFLLVVLLALLPRFWCGPLLVFSFGLVTAGWLIFLVAGHALVTASYGAVIFALEAATFLGLSLLTCGLCFWVLPWLAVHRGEVSSFFDGQTYRLRRVVGSVLFCVSQLGWGAERAVVFYSRGDGRYPR
jgi:hypothetical protein